MVDKKRKDRGDNRQKKERVFKKNKGSNGSKKNKKEERRRRGPGLPNALRKEIDILNSAAEASNSEDEEFDFHGVAANDFYEYEETVAEEEKKKNRRFDPVENYEYQIPGEIEESEDEVIESDKEVKEGNNAKDEDGGMHSRMLQGITGLPGDAFEGGNGGESTGQ